MSNDLVNEPQHAVVETLRKLLPEQDFVVVFGERGSRRLQVASNQCTHDEVMQLLGTAFAMWMEQKYTKLHQDNRRY